MAIVIKDTLNAGRERAIADTDEARRLQIAVFDALQAYADYLNRQGLIRDGDALEADCLVASLDFRDDLFDIALEGGPLDRFQD